MLENYTSEYCFWLNIQANRKKNSYWMKFPDWLELPQREDPRLKITTWQANCLCIYDLLWVRSLRLGGFSRVMTKNAHTLTLSLHAT